MQIIDISEAVQKLSQGELVIIPTETVYGLAADAFHEKAVEKIFEVKGRPRKNPSILHISDFAMLQECVKEISLKAKVLMEKFWPGPLTLVLKKSDKVPDIVTGGLPTVCIRMPRHEMTLKLIKELGHPIAAPSANISSRPSATTLEAATEDLGKRGVKFALNPSASQNSFDSDLSESEIGLESTIVDVTGDTPLLLRLGGVSQEDIEKVLGEKLKILQPSKENSSLIVKAPGMAFKHYSPEGHIILVYPWEVFGEKVSRQLSSQNEENYHFAAVEEALAYYYQNYICGVICVEERAKLYEGYQVLALGPAYDLNKQAHHLFKVLLQTEKLGWQKVIVDMTDIGGDKGIGPAILERLRRAAEI